MYRIAVLADKEQIGHNYANQLISFCSKKGVFPQVEVYRNEEDFFYEIQIYPPTSALISLCRVAGLSVVEHLRTLYPNCGIIWCSDLDFSLHVFRLRVEYFFMEPVENEKFQEGLSVLNAEE